ncbi:MAG: amidohydrolase family protein [Elioraea sp.]|nr:amidohydrolase family protein [Elioraea sp.]
MALAAGVEKQVGKLVIKNVGLVVSGDLAQPLLDADTIVAEGGRIVAIGREKDCDAEGARIVVDAKGCAAIPGLIDNHVHTVFGDWTPRQNQLGWIESCLHGGVTSMISAGEVHLPGRPRDPLGAKALAIVARRSFGDIMTNGVRVLAGAVIPERGLTEADFAEMAAAGVRLMGEIGLGSVTEAEEAREMVAMARRHGLSTVTHVGGPSVPGSSYIGADVVLAADSDVCSHINGGPTALDQRQIRRICEETTRAVEIIHNGNPRVALFAMRLMLELGKEAQLTLGTDAPAGSGVQPLGMLRTISLLCSVGGAAPERAICWATGNVARVRGLAQGVLAVGRPADLVLCDRPQGSDSTNVLEALTVGDLPGIGMVITDGVIRVSRSRNTPPAERMPERLV